MVEIGHAEDCPGCLWVLFTAEDRSALPGYVPEHERRPSPKPPTEPSWWNLFAYIAFRRALVPWLKSRNAWKAQQFAVLGTLVPEDNWPCPECDKPSCVAHLRQHGERMRTAARNTRLFSGIFDGV